MLVRLRVGCIIVDRLLAEGVRFATARDSQMNKRVRERLNELAQVARSQQIPRQTDRPGRGRVCIEANQRVSGLTAPVRGKTF